MCAWPGHGQYDTHCCRSAPNQHIDLTQHANMHALEVWAVLTVAVAVVIQQLLPLLHSVDCHHEGVRPTTDLGKNNLQCTGRYKTIATIPALPKHKQHMLRRGGHVQAPAAGQSQPLGSCRCCNTLLRHSYMPKSKNITTMHMSSQAPVSAPNVGDAQQPTQSTAANLKCGMPYSRC